MGNGDPQGLPEQEPEGSQLGQLCSRAGKMAAAGVLRITPDGGAGEHGLFGDYNTGKIVSPLIAWALLCSISEHTGDQHRYGLAPALPMTHR